MNITNVTPTQLRQAADLQEKIVQLQSELAAVLGNEVEAVPVAKPAKKVGMSAAGRARIAAAQKARWAKRRGASATPAPAKTAAKAPRKKRTMSPEARAKIAAAQKARWAKRKAA